MAKAYINLEDLPDGAVSANFIFEDELSGGFNRQSGAHQAANAVRAELDKIMTKVDEGVVSGANS